MPWEEAREVDEYFDNTQQQQPPDNNNKKLADPKCQ